jgi:hypothetical protein
MTAVYEPYAATFFQGAQELGVRRTHQGKNRMGAGSAKRSPAADALRPRCPVGFGQRRIALAASMP